MLKWTAIALLAVLTSAAQPAADQQPLPVGTPESPLKNATGAGHYYGGGEKDYKKDHGSYGRASYGGDYSTSYHQLIDDYVCDADASILVVTNSHKGYDRKEYKEEKGYESDKSYGGDKGGYGSDKGYGYGKSYGKGYSRPEGISGKDYGRSHETTYEHKNYAERLRCASIAVQSDRDCSQCCRIAARRDRSVSKEDIVGFVVDYDQVNTHNRIGYGEEKDYGGKSYGHEEKGYGGEGGYGNKGGEYKREKGGYGSEKGGYGGEYKRSKRSGDQETYPVEDKIGGGGGHHHGGDNKGHGHHSGEAHPPGYTPEDKGYRHEKKYDNDHKGYGGHEEKGYSGKGYGKADYGSDYSRIEVADYYKPSNPRCVCCSPKRYVHRESYGYGGGDYGRKGEY